MHGAEAAASLLLNMVLEKELATACCMEMICFQSRNGHGMPFDDIVQRVRTYVHTCTMAEDNHDHHHHREEVRRTCTYVLLY